MRRPPVVRIARPPFCRHADGSISTRQTDGGFVRGPKPRAK